MTKIEFFITRRGREFVLLGIDDEPLLYAVFESREAAADMAMRFAQDAGLLYALHY